MFKDIEMMEGFSEEEMLELRGKAFYLVSTASAKVLGQKLSLFKKARVLREGKMLRDKM